LLFGERRHVPRPFTPPKAVVPKVAVEVGDQAGLRVRAIGAIGERAEADKGGGSAGVAVGGLGDLEDRAAAIRPPPFVVPNRLPFANTRDKNYTPGAIRLRMEQVDASIARMQY